MSRIDTAASADTISHFRIATRLGAGGMGIVYRAQDLLLHRSVALKVMRPEHAADPQRRERFLREARAAASLTHANIATVYEVGEERGTIFIAMELVPGESLRAMLGSALRRRVDASRALRWSVGIARALAHAHDAGIVHRDLKPDNVMVGLGDEVKLLDFGVAEWLERKSGEPSGPKRAPADEPTDATVMGTPAYVSPEQARGERVDARSDVFSFGVMLYEMLSGIRPFQRSTPLDTLAAVVRDPPAPLHVVAQEVSAEVVAIVTRCLAKRAGDRFADGRALLEALQAALTGELTTEAAALAPAPMHDGKTLPLPALGASAKSQLAAPRARGEEPRARRGRLARWAAMMGALVAAGSLAVVVAQGRPESRDAPRASAAADRGPWVLQTGTTDGRPGAETSVREATTGPGLP